MELTFDALSKNYGKKQALIGFSAELTGGIYGLLGPNGAGKSTLMNILTGNLRQTAGEIRFNGAEIRSLGAAFRGRVGYMPQQQTLYPGFTAERERIGANPLDRAKYILEKRNALTAG